MIEKNYIKTDSMNENLLQYPGKTIHNLTRIIYLLSPTAAIHYYLRIISIMQKCVTTRREVAFSFLNALKTKFLKIARTCKCKFLCLWDIVFRSLPLVSRYLHNLFRKSQDYNYQWDPKKHWNEVPSKLITACVWEVYYHEFGEVLY